MVTKSIWISITSNKMDDGRAKFYLARRCTSMGPHVVEVVLVFRGSSCSRESHDRCIKLGQRAAWKAFKRSRNKATEEKKEKKETQKPKKAKPQKKTQSL